MIRVLSEDHQTLVDAVRDFARSELPPLDQGWDRADQSCCADLSMVSEMGLLGLRLSEEFGGLDLPMVAYAHMIRELAYASPSVAVTLAVHNMVAETLRTLGSDEIKDGVVPQLAQPDQLCAYAVSEPNAGSSPAEITTRAERVDGGYRLSGAKMWVTNGVNARWIIVLARTGDAGDHRDLSVLLLDTTSDGVTRNAIHGKMGIRGSETADMSLDGAFVPEGFLVGEIGAGMRVALTALNSGRISIASQAVGIAAAAFDLMRQYALDREQFGRSIAKFQAIQGMIADSKTELLAAQRLIDRAAWLKDQGRRFVREASMAKLFASESAGRICDRAVQVHGGYGYVSEFRVEQLYRDARITRIYEGTSEVQRIVIARELLRNA